MIQGKTVLGLIPARGGSKGVSRKNLRPLAGKPLLQWTAEAALASKHVDRLIVSTEDAEIAEVAASIGVEVPFRRPDALATDNAHVIEVVNHAIATLDEHFDYLLLLEPTSPLRSTGDIDGCVEALVGSGCDYGATVSVSPFRPEWMFYVTSDGRLDPVIGRLDDRPRQELPPCYIFNGAIYAVCVEAFLRDLKLTTDQTVAYVMPPERSIDINDQADMDSAERMLLQGMATPG